MRPQVCSTSVEQVRGQHDRQAALAVERRMSSRNSRMPSGSSPSAGSSSRIRSGRGQERLCQREPLAHPVAVDAHRIVDAFFQADEPHGFHHSSRGHPAGKRGEDRQVAPAAQVIVERGRLEDRANPLQGLRAIALHGKTVHERLTAARVEMPQQQAEGRALARAVVAEQAEHLALFDLQRERFERGFALE